jgi:hypothetical protein
MQSQMSLHNPQSRSLLRFIQMSAVLGFIYGALTLARDTAPNADGLQWLYTSWFILAVFSTQAILYGLKMGVVILAVSTLVVMVAELLVGVASVGGASLGMLVAFLIAVYIVPEWETLH